MQPFHMLDDRQRTLFKNLRSRTYVDNTVLTLDNFRALIDFIEEKDRHWTSLQLPVDLSVLSGGS